MKIQIQEKVNKVASASEEPDDDVEGRPRFLLPGDDGFEVDRPMKDVDGGEEVEEEKHEGKKGRSDEQERGRYTIKEVMEECENLAGSEGSDSEEDLPLPKRIRGGKKAPPKKRMKRCYPSDDGESTDENEF